MDAAKVLPDGSKTYMGFRGGTLGGFNESATLPADPALIAAAEAAGGRLTSASALPIWPGVEARPVVHRGVVGSSDTWTQHRPSIETLHEQHGTMCEEMEASSIAAVCASFGVPFLAVKDISNNELRDDTTDSLLKVAEEIGKRAAMVVHATIAAMAEPSPRL